MCVSFGLFIEVLMSQCAPNMQKSEKCICEQGALGIHCLLYFLLPVLNVLQISSNFNIRTDSTSTKLFTFLTFFSSVYHAFARIRTQRAKGLARGTCLYIIAKSVSGMPTKKKHLKKCKHQV